MKITKKKIILATLLSILNINLTACGEKVETLASVSQNLEVSDILDSPILEDEFEEEETNNNYSPILSQKRVETSKINLVEATDNVNIRNNNDEIIGVLPKGKTLDLLGVLDTRYAVLYYGQTGYVSKDYSKEVIGYTFCSPIKKIVYTTKEIELSLPEYIGDEIINIPKLECFEVYDEYEDCYYVKNYDYVGFIPKEGVKELTGTFIVIDISEQELKLYKDNEVILVTPVVTGKKSTPTDTGLFAIYDISYNRYLIGPNYKTWVDIMMKYNGNEGLHDAEYHTDENGRFHGWRSSEEFGGKTYINNGSHGCVNMLHEDVFEVSEYVSIGTPVLVKK